MSLLPRAKFTNLIIILTLIVLGGSLTFIYFHFYLLRYEVEYVPKKGLLSMKKLELLEDVYISESKDHLYFGNRCIELVFSKKNGCLLKVVEKASNVTVIDNAEEKPTEIIMVDGRTKHISTPPYNIVVESYDIGPKEYLGRRVDIINDEGDIKVKLIIYSKADSWYFYSTYTIKPKCRLVERSLKVAYFGSDRHLIRGMELILSGVGLSESEGCIFEAPGLMVKPHLPLKHLQNLSKISPYPDLLPKPGFIFAGISPILSPGVMVIHDPKSALGLMWWAYSDVEPFLTYLSVKENGRISVIHHSVIADRSFDGHVLTCKSQYIYVFNDTWRNALKHLKDWWGTVGLSAPRDRPDEIMRFNIYEVHIGDTYPTWNYSYSPFPEIDDLIAALPKIKRLGFNVICLMPHMPLPQYSVVDYFNVSKTYLWETKDADEKFRRLIDEAHKLGIKVILDWITHGSNVKVSNLHMEHPEWYMKTESGDIAMTYTYSFNLADREVQDYIIEAMKFYVRKFDVDGFRIDAPQWNFFPNWDPKIPYRASYSTFGGAKILLERARMELKRIKPDIIFYVENTGPQLLGVADFLYSHEEQRLHIALATGEITAREAAEWLEERDMAFPKGFIKAHHLESHGTHYHSGGKFRWELLGVKPSRALFALCAFMGGPVHNYVGGERGSEDFYRKVLDIRNSIPELTYGDWNYTIVKSTDDMIFTILRSYNGNHTIVVINFNPKQADFRLQIPIKDLNLNEEFNYTVYDAFNNIFLKDPNGRMNFKGREISNLKMRMNPYSIAVLQIREAESNAKKE